MTERDKEVGNQRMAHGRMPLKWLARAAMFFFYQIVWMFCLVPCNLNAHLVKAKKMHTVLQQMRLRTSLSMEVMTSWCLSEMAI